MTLGELGELAVVVRRQVVANLAQLLVDDVEVVEEPLGRRRDGLLVLDRPGQDAVRVEQDAAVLGDARSYGVSPTGRVGHRLGGGEGLRVLLEPLHAEQFREDGLSEFRFGPRSPSTSPWRIREGLVRRHRSRRTVRADAI